MDLGIGSKPTRLQIGLALAAIYVLWGSTFLAIRVAVSTIPPFLMAAARWTTAGTILYSWARFKGAPRPRAEHWLNAAVVALLLIVLSNGVVTWAETRVTSGLTALLIASVSLFMVLLDWLRPGGRRPEGRVVVGLVLGFSGVALLVGPSHLAGAPVDRAGALGLLFAAFSFAAGSLLSPKVRLPESRLLGTGMEMLAGGAMLVAVGLARGERVDPARVAPASLLGVAYLVVFGSLVGFTLYVWLMRVAPPALVSTYACVNPVVAVFLGWAFAGEPIGTRTIAATAVIVGAVALIISSRAAGRPESKPVLATKTVPMECDA